MLRILLLFCLLQFSFLPLAIGQEYIIHGQQLERLEQNLISLKRMNEQLQQELQTLHELQKQQEQQLTNVSVSFAKYEDSQRRKLRQSKLRVNLLVAGGLACLLLK